MRLINRFLTVQAMLVVSEYAEFAALRIEIAAQLAADHPWLTLDGDRVTAVDFAAYAKPSGGRKPRPPSTHSTSAAAKTNSPAAQAKISGTSPPTARHTAASPAPAWQMRRPSNK